MPIYTYWCDTCKEYKERMAPVTARDLVACADCDSKDWLVRKQDLPARVWGPTRNQ